MSGTDCWVVMVDRQGVQLACEDCPHAEGAMQLAASMRHREDYQDLAEVIAYQANGDPDTVADVLVRFQAPDAAQGDLFS